MGVMLTPIIHREATTLKALSNRSFAIDGNIELHQFLALIRKRDGSLFTDSTGHITSHLIGLLTRTTRLVADYRMKLVFVFDGKFNPLKRRTVEQRKKSREKATLEYDQAIARGDSKSAWSKAVMTGRVTSDILGDAKRLLTLMGLPWMEAIEDGEAQASYMAQKGDVWGTGSKDYDSLLYGTPRLVRYLTITGTEFLPAQLRARKLKPEVIDLQLNLRELGIDRKQLVDLAILVGTDFDEGIKGIGPKKALTLVRKHGRIEDMPPSITTALPGEIEEIRQIFLHPRIKEDYRISASRPDAEGLKRFLVDERGFSPERVTKVAETLLKAFTGAKDSTLGAWTS